MRIDPIYVEDYDRITANDHIRMVPIRDSKLREWAGDALDRLRARWTPGEFEMTYVTSGDGMVVLTICRSGLIDVYYCNIRDHHFYRKVD